MVLLRWLFSSVLILALVVAAGLRNRLWVTELVLLKDTAAKSPRKVRVLYNLGNTFVHQQLYDEAIKYYHAALQFAPDRSEIHNQLGGIYLTWGDYSRAVEELEKAVLSGRENVEATYNLAGALVKVGRINDAVTYYRRFLSMAGQQYIQQIEEANVFLRTHDKTTR